MRQKIRKSSIWLITLVLLCIMCSSIAAVAEEALGTICVAFGCEPGYEGAADVTVTEVSSGETYKAVVSIENGWIAEISVPPGTYKAVAEVVSDNEEDICVLDENERTVEAGGTNSFAGTIGNEWRAMERAAIINEDAIDENGRQRYYGEMTERDVDAYVKEMTDRSEGEIEDDSVENGENGGAIIGPETDAQEPDEGSTAQAPETPEPEQERGSTFLTVVIIVLLAAILAVFAVGIFRKKDDSES